MHEPTYLDLIRLARVRVSEELNAIARERSPFYVAGRYYATAQDASTAKGRIVEKCMRDLERLDDAIARLTVEAVGVVDDDITDAELFDLCAPSAVCLRCHVTEIDGDASMCADCRADRVA
jgi:hypothetical protein